MTIELKTGKKGELHISSEDDRLLHCRSFGTGAYVLSGCAVTMTSANKAHIAEGELMVQGGYVRITGGGEDVAIANGVAGQKRNTIIALTYTRDSNGIEAMSFAAVDGSSIAGTPSDPIVTTSDINAGASSSMWKFARIQLDGLTVGTPQVLFATKAAALLDQISSLSSQVASLQDSVSREGEWYVAKVGSAANIVFKHQVIESLGFEQKEYVYNYDLPANCGTPVVGFVNATQWRVANARVTFPSSKEVRVVTPITRPVSSSGPDDIYYNDFDLTVICVPVIPYP